MMRALNTAATGMVAQQFNLDAIAHNLANVNTTGFKQMRAEFQDLVYDTLRASGAETGGAARLPGAIQIGLGVKLSATSSNMAPGSMQSTGNPLDLSIRGDGFFVVLKPDGTNGYTRDGSFKRDANGLVVTSDGYPLQPEVTIPAGANSITVTQTGIISAVLPGQSLPTQLGQLTIATFANPAGLTRIGQNLFSPGGGSGDPQLVTPGQQGSGTIESSFLESSNVQIVEEMVRMIMAQRAYEINSKAIMTADEMLGQLNNLKR